MEPLIALIARITLEKPKADLGANMECDSHAVGEWVLAQRVLVKMQ